MEIVLREVTLSVSVSVNSNSSGRMICGNTGAQLSGSLLGSASFWACCCQRLMGDPVGSKRIANDFLSDPTFKGMGSACSFDSTPGNRLIVGVSITDLRNADADDQSVPRRGIEGAGGSHPLESGIGQEIIRDSFRADRISHQPLAAASPKTGGPQQTSGQLGTRVAANHAAAGIRVDADRYRQGDFPQNDLHSDNRGSWTRGDDRYQWSAQGGRRLHVFRQRHDSDDQR